MKVLTFKGGDTFKERKCGEMVLLEIRETHPNLNHINVGKKNT